jgi:hypothetical protein
MAVLGACGGTKLTIKTSTPSGPLPDGKTPAEITITVTNNDKAVADSVSPTVKVAVDNGQFAAYADGATRDDTGQQTTTLTLNTGVAKAELYAIKAGTSTITITYSDANGGAASATATVVFGTVTSGQAKNIVFVSAIPDKLGLTGAGTQTTSQVTFKVTDVTGATARDGLKINFALSANPGDATLSPTSAITQAGQVTTVVTAGSIPQSVKVIATVDSDATITTQSGTISISGSGVNFDKFSLTCDHYSIGGFGRFGLTDTCTVFAADRNGSFVDNTQISLMTEAGGVPSSVPLVNAGPQGGTASFPYQTQCPLPVDVHPQGNEFSDTHCQFYNQCRQINGNPSPGLEDRTCNQRDGVATLVAYVQGEECFKDKNGDHIYNDGEFDSKCDLGEPFLDENDNDKWDPPCSVDPSNCDADIPEGEPFIDADNNGTWTGPNGRWDSQTLIWRKVSITWTGEFDPSRERSITSASRGSLLCGTSDSIEYQMSDTSGNWPASVGASDSVLLASNPGGAAFAIASYPITDCGVVCAPSLSSGTQSCGIGCSTNALSYNSNHLPQFHVGYFDANGCSSASPPPPPDPFVIQITVTRSEGTGVVGTTAVESTAFRADISHGDFQN